MVWKVGWQELEADGPIVSSVRSTEMNTGACLASFFLWSLSGQDPSSSSLGSSTGEPITSEMVKESNTLKWRAV